MLFNYLCLQRPTQNQLKEHLHLLAERHPLLRSGFCVSGSPISAYSQLTWKNIDDSQIMLVDAFDSAFSMQNQEMLLRPLRFQCRKATGHVELSLQIHHALYDQWSIEILIEDLSSLLDQGDIPPRPAFGVVNDYFLNLKLFPDSQSQSLDFWQGYLSGASPGHLPNLRDEAIPVGPLAVAKHCIDIDMSEIPACRTIQWLQPSRLLPGDLFLFAQHVYGIQRHSLWYRFLGSNLANCGRRRHLWPDPFYIANTNQCLGSKEV